jgi:predicted nucleotidyltransferase
MRITPMSVQEILGMLDSQKVRLRQLGVTKLGLFGSAARESMHIDSDLDFIVELQPKTLDNLLSLKFLLEDTYGRKIDLVLTHTLRPEIRQQVLNETHYVSGL